MRIVRSFPPFVKSPGFPPALGSIILTIEDIKMTDQDTALLIEEILAKAKENRAQPFRTILYWSEFRYYKNQRSATKLIIKTLQYSAKKLFKSYIKDIKLGIQDVNTLLAYRQLLDITAFYKEELTTLNKMIKDYDAYLDDGHFWHSFFGGRRET